VTESEAQWLAQAQQGDPQAFARLVARYQRPVCGLCYRMLGNAGDAEDAAQETFLRAYQNLARYDRRRVFRTWLLSIASHHCIDQLRKRRLETVPLETDDDNHPVPSLPDPAPGPEASRGERERQAQVQALLERLSPTDRAAVVLRYWHDCSYEEIAAELSLSIGAIRSRLHHTRRQLAAYWQANESQRERKKEPA
jgi:RNA polymerase sigma-70 factor (ECF subfamily)